MPLVLAVRVVQLHSDLSYVVALPVQPQHLVTELSDASGHSFEFVAVFVVDPLHLLLHVREVGGHVALHALGEGLVDIVHRSQVPLVLPRFDLDESIVVTGLYDGVVHRERVVEVDVGDVLRKRVLAQSNDLLHTLQVVRLVAQFLQRLLSEVQVDVDVLRVVDVDVVVRGVVRGVDNRSLLGRRWLFRYHYWGYTFNLLIMNQTSFVCTETFETTIAHRRFDTSTNMVMTIERFLTGERLFTFITVVSRLRIGVIVSYDILSLRYDILSLRYDILSPRYDILSLRYDILSLGLNRIGGVYIRQIRTTWRFPSFMPTQIEHPCCNVRTMFTFVHGYPCNLHNKTFF